MVMGISFSALPAWSLAFFVATANHPHKKSMCQEKWRNFMAIWRP